MNEGFGKDFYRKGNSAKRFGPFTAPPDSETEKLLSLSPLSGPLRLRVQSRSRRRLRLFRACFKGVLDTIAPLSRG